MNWPSFFGWASLPGFAFGPDRRFRPHRPDRRAQFGIDCLFVTRGIHAEEFEGPDQFDPKSVMELFGHPPKALMRELKW